MINRIVYALLVLLVILTAFGCVPKDDSLKSEETQDTLSITESKDAEPETTVAVVDAEEERDDSEQTQPSTECATEEIEFGTTSENTDATNVDQVESTVTQPQETESETTNGEPYREEDETERDEG